MTTDGETVFPNDLMMDVLYETQGTIVLIDKVRVVVIVYFTILSFFVSFIPVKEKRDHYVDNAVLHSKRRDANA